MSRPLLALVALVVLSACGGGPASPGGGAIQPLLDSMTPEIKVNGVTVQGPTASVNVGQTVNYQINYSNNSGQTLHTGILLVRDDGVETLISCGASGSGGQGGGFGAGWSFSSSDRGHTVRVLLIGALGATSGQCLFQPAGSSPSGPVNHGAIQAERLLISLAVQ